MNCKKLFLLTFIALFAFSAKSWAQGESTPSVDHSYKPLTVKLDDSGKKYVRFILWHQFWLTGQENTNGDFRITPTFRRSRMLAYAQISPRFLILTHFGLNNMNSSRMSISGVQQLPNGQDNYAQLFMHDAWGEYKVSKNNNLYVGAGLHYWNGLSRLTNQSTLNMLTLDMPNPFFTWHSLGSSDQFARHIGMYAKGSLGKLQYRVSVNDALANNFQATATPTTEAVTYNTKALLNGSKGGMVLQGYFDYNFLDQESNKLPYKVGTYLGKKKVFNVGAGFFLHPDGANRLREGRILTPGTPVVEDDLELINVSHFAVDAFYDAPVGEGAITAYASFFNFNYGEGGRSLFANTGQVFHGTFAYLLPRVTDYMQLQPYVAFNMKNYDAFDNSGNQLNVGANWFVNGHFAKITLEYQSTLAPYNEGSNSDRTNQWRMQMHFFL